MITTLQAHANSTKPSGCKTKTHLKLLCLAITFTTIMVANKVCAQTINWVGSSSADYGTPSNWDPTTFNPVSPVGTEVVVIGPGSPNNPIQVGGNSTKRVAKLNTVSGSHFTVRGTLYPNSSDMLNGYVSVEGNADFNIRNNVMIGNGTLGTVTVLGGTLSSRGVIFVGRNAGGVGTLNIWGGKVNAGTDFQVGTTGATGSVSFKSVGTLAIPGNKVAYLQSLLSGGLITVDGDRPLDITYTATTNITTASIFQDPTSLLKEYATDVVLDNGTIKATIRKNSGEVTSLLYKGKEMVSTTGAHTKIYYDWTSSYGFETMSNCTFSVKKLNDSIVDVSFKRVYAPVTGQFTPADMDIHYALKQNDTGLYTYSITEHQPSYPDVDLGSWRMVMWIANNGVKNLCEKIYVDGQRHWEMPSVYDFSMAEPSGITEIVKLTTGVRAGKYDGKYEYSKSLWELDAVGHASDINNAGTWFVYGSHEFFNDGPSFDDLNAAAGIIHATLNGVHYGSKGFVIPQGEYWRKIYGPFLLYFNDKSTGDQAWVDAKARAKKESAQWPYSWLDNNPAYPLHDGRGNVSGKFSINDPFKPTLHGDSAWIGVTQLSNSNNEWQFEAKNYQYWVKTGDDGNFVIPNIRPGTYSLFAYKNGEVGEYALENVVVTAGTSTNLGELVWNIPRAQGGLAWEVGIANRTAREFKYGDQAYSEGFLWNKFGTLFSNPIEYNVADKNWGDILNYAQSPYPDTSGVLQPWKWRINFDLPVGLPATGNATLTIAYASSDHSNQYLYVNNETSRFTSFYPPNGGGNALLRQENHAKYGVSKVSIPMGRLRAGKNTITLVMASAQSIANHIMYDYLSLEVPGIPTARIAAAPTTGLGPLTVSFDATSSLHIQNDSLTYHWNFGDGTTGTGTRATHTYTIHGVYKATLTVKDTNNATDTTSVNITVLNNAPVAAFTATPPTGYAPLLVDVDASSTTDNDRDSIVYTWNFGDGTTATGMKLQHEYTSPGTYAITLVATDNLGAIDSASVTVNAVSGLKVQYKLAYQEINPFDNTININIKIINASNTPVPYSELAVRYWYTKEGAANQLFNCEFAQLGTRKVTGNLIPLTQPRVGSDYYMELTFSTTSAIAANANSGVIETTIRKTNRSAFNERDDYSYNPTKKQYSDWDHITVYRKGKLFWGVEPASLPGPAGPAPGEEHPCHIYPNPSHGQIQVKGSLSEHGVVTITIYTMLGKILLQENLGPRDAGDLSHVMETTAIPPGTYYVRVTLATRSYVLMFIKE